MLACEYPSSLPLHWCIRASWSEKEEEEEKEEDKRTHPPTCRCDGVSGGGGGGGGRGGGGGSGGGGGRDIHKRTYTRTKPFAYSHPQAYELETHMSVYQHQFRCISRAATVE